ncbi:MAG TPA: class I SAM-dependent methyltransferase, partial [Deltaproteobacteria bacterium]|nr:class I SAM-dependent methyltransferase [Deltaproteobacteria bacterium]
MSDGTEVEGSPPGRVAALSRLGGARPRYPESLIRRLAALADGGSVLSVCAGTGEIARGLAAAGLSVVALEASEARIAVGRRQPHGQRVRWEQGCAEGARLGGP